MLVYKVTFLNNKIISCGVTDPLKHKAMREDVYFSQNKGLLIFALIKANSKDQALQKASKLLEDFPSNYSFSAGIYHNTTDHNESFMIDPIHSGGPVSTPDYIDTTCPAGIPYSFDDAEGKDDARSNTDAPR